MSSLESGRCGANPQSPPDPSHAIEREESGGLCYCPACGTSLRVVGGSIEMAAQGDQSDAPFVPGSAAIAAFSASASEPGGSTEVAFDSTEDTETPEPAQSHAVANAASAPEDSVPVDWEATDRDEPTTLLGSPESQTAFDTAEPEGGVLDIDSMLESPAPPEPHEASEELEVPTERRPSPAPEPRPGLGVASDAAQGSKTADGSGGRAAAPSARDEARVPILRGAGSASSIGFVHASGAPAVSGGVAVAAPSVRVSEPSQGAASHRSGSPSLPAEQGLSDAPITRDTEPAARGGSARGYVGLGLGMAALGVAFIVYSQVRSTDSGERGAAAVALEPAVVVTPAEAKPSDAEPAASVEARTVAVGASQSETTEVAPGARDVAAVVPTKAGTKVSESPGRVRSALTPPPDASATAQPKAEIEEEEVLEPNVAKFDADAAASALESAAGRASSCRQAADPSGVAVVTITFAPSGRVTTATIAGPPFVGTATGSCIASTLRTAEIPAFDGAHVTVRKKVTIR